MLDFTDWARAQIDARAEQGLAPTITDPAVLATLAAILGRGVK